MAGKVAVVTGASAGVGRAAAQEFGRRGYRVGLIARGEKGLEGARREIEEQGGQAFVAPADVADPEQVEEAAESIEAALGPIDVWVNNAMVTVFAPVWDVAPDEFRRATEVTYLGTVYGSLTALKRFRARNRGKIVQVGSALAYRAIPLQSAYCASKFAIRGFTDSLRTELMHEGSRVGLTMVQLPGLNTPQFEQSRAKLPGHPMPVPPIFQPEVAGRAIVWAAEHDRREVVVGGPSLMVIYGNKLAPGIADRYLARTGFKAQQMDRPLGPRPDNLYQPVDRDWGAHGIFDGQAKSRSWQVLANLHRGTLAAAAAIVAGGLTLAVPRITMRGR
jgi:NAD(P)-dependent dehydrogenase (short-subunit alcohol dehydrogenase family)